MYQNHPDTSTLDNAGLTPEEEQEKFKTDSINQVKVNSFQMKRALDKSNLQEALRYASLMLGELRTNLLSPQKYYELYIKASDELQFLEQHFADEVKRVVFPYTWGEAWAKGVRSSTHDGRKFVHWCSYLSPHSNGL